MVKKDKVNNYKYKNIRKNRNKIVQILAKSKSWNLFKSRPRYLFVLKKKFKISVL